MDIGRLSEKPYEMPGCGRGGGGRGEKTIASLKLLGYPHLAGRGRELGLWQGIVALCSGKLDVLGRVLPCLLRSALFIICFIYLFRNDVQ